MIINFILVLATCLVQIQSDFPSDFSTLQRMSAEELALKTQTHKEAWGLGKIDRWDLSQDTGELVFSLPDGMKTVCPAQIIGTYNSQDQTWLWAWANPSIDEKLRADALKVRKYGEEHHIDRLTKSKWKGTEDEAWSMAALAVKLCGEQGAYRGPAGTTYVFIAFGEVKLSRK
jgi:hypothetical protein